MILCDTNVIIETLKGDEKTIKIIERIGLENIAISSVTVMELYFGALNKRELNKIKKYLKALNIAHFDNNVSELAVSMIESYNKSHGLQIPDAIIAATALSFEMKLFILNLKDFKYIDGLKLQKN
ncbi:MAG: type II toxin-antitoxin system VapC family toxin [Deltaproteobacteria bacterium]|nr:type II toxin-antitoxin system VapC family toxin [Deltaproteobacteria bacterium]MDL1961141.1 type II toxin-antitoxin system VapC family toxin [Deltaproteobacteria bacterium]